MWFNSSYNTLKTYHCYYWWEGRRCLLSRGSLCIKRSGPWWSLCMGRPGSRSCSTWHSWRAEDPTGRGSASRCGPGAPGDRRKSPRFHTLLHTWKWKKTEVTLKKKNAGNFFRASYLILLFNATPEPKMKQQKGMINSTWPDFGCCWDVGRRRVHRSDPPPGTPGYRRLWPLPPQPGARSVGASSKCWRTNPEKGAHIQWGSVFRIQSSVACSRWRPHLLFHQDADPLQHPLAGVLIGNVGLDLKQSHMKTADGDKLLFCEDTWKPGTITKMHNLRC